tara:strand:+ start:439 stop:1083 length:645 start_codon:yes stop_codon:yes gene_type:complete
MKIHRVFPQPIYFSKLERELTKDELKLMNKLHPKDHNKVLKIERETVVNNQISSDTYVLERKELKNLKKELDKMIFDYFDKIVCSRNSITPYITQSWLNYAGPNQSHQLHSHPNSYISGVFYAAAHKKVDDITFFKSTSQRHADRIELEPKTFNTFNASSWWFPVETGDVILFPSSLEHGVNNKKGNNLRISLSFNVFLKGRIGTPTKLTDLVL